MTVVIRDIGVVVPAKDEEDLLPRCLDALARAAARIVVPVHVVVVLDNCTDRSLAVVGQAKNTNPDIDLRARTIRADNVGAARRHGMATILTGLNADTTWLATTDADSAVPPHWFASQLAHAASGAEVVIGTVAVSDWSDRSTSVRHQAELDYDLHGHRHIHGANLAFTARSYLAVGGFAERETDEDVTLVSGFIAAQVPVVWALDAPVETSARRVARVRAGFAGYLNDLEDAAEEAVPVSEHPAN